MKIGNFSDVKSLFLENKGLKQTVFKNAFWLALSEGITRILKLFLIIYVARILGATEYGKFTFALSFVSMLVIFSDLGLNSLTIREMSQEKKTEEFLPFVLSLKTTLSSIVLFVIFIFSFFITSSIEIRELIWILGIYMSINSFSSIIYSFFRAKEKMRYESFARILQSVIITLVGFFILFNFPSIKNLGLSYLFASFSAFIFIILIFHSEVRRLSINFNKTLWKKILTLSLPIGLASVYGIIYTTADSVIMGIYNQTIQLGWYNASLKIIDITFVLASVISSSFFPILSKLYHKSKNNFYKTWNLYFQLMIILAIPLIVGGVVLAPKIIRLVYNSDYFPSILTFQILILFAGISFVSGPFNQILFIYNRQGNLFWIGLFGAIINIFLNLILIPKYSLYGAAIARVITYSLIFILLLRQFLKLTTIKIFNLILFIIGIVISSSIMFFVISIPQIYSLPVLIIVALGIIVYMLLFLIYKKIISNYKQDFNLL